MPWKDALQHPVRWYRGHRFYRLQTATVIESFRTNVRGGFLNTALEIARFDIPASVGRQVIADLLTAETVPFGTGAFLAAAKVSWSVYRDPTLTIACAERAEEIELWRECARIWYLMRKHWRHGKRARREMARAARECIPRLVKDGQFTEAIFVVEPFFTTYEEKCAAYRDLYNIFLEIGEPLQAAWLAQKWTKFGFTMEDVRHAAVLAYRQALEHPEPPIEGEPPDAPSDANLIWTEFGLTEEDLTA